MSKGLETPQGIESVEVDEDGGKVGEEEVVEGGTPEAVKNLRLQPLNDFVLIFPDTGKKYQGKIELISEGTVGLRKTKFRGLVVAAGPKCEAVEKGQYVYFWKHAGSIQFIENFEFRVCRENEVLAIDLRSEEEVGAEDELGGSGDSLGQDRTLPERAKAAAEAHMIEEGKKENVGDFGDG